MTDATDLSLPAPAAGAATKAPTPAAVLAEVTTLIAEVVGEEYLLAVEIDADTSFNEDLELESIEFVALAERLTETYGERVDFVAWLAEKELDELIAMTVGELVTFVHESLSGA